MSYSHFWFRPIEIDKDVFSNIVLDYQKVESHLRRKGIRIEYVADNEFFFSEGHELFFFPRIMHEDFKQIFLMMKDGRIFHSCKTNRKRYDLAVMVVLLIVKHHLGSKIIVTSNGGEWDWQSAKEFCLEHLGYGEDFVPEEEPGFDQMAAEIKITYFNQKDGNDHG